MGYIVKFRKIIVILEYYSVLKYSTNIMDVEDFNKIKSKHPYAQYQHFELENIDKKKTIPKSIKNKVISLPEIQSEIRNKKIESIIDENKSNI
jgi:hypothetical protein